MLTILEVEGGYALEGGGLQRTMVMMGDKLASMGSGWSPASASKFANAIIAFNLKHLDGQEATWLLNNDCRYLAGSVEALPEEDKAEFLEKAKRWMDAVAWDFLNAPGFANRNDLLGFFEISQEIRDDLIRRLGVPEIQMPVPITVDGHVDTDIRTVSGTKTLTAKNLSTCVSASIDDQFVEACRVGRMSWNSPVDGTPVYDVRGFALSHILMAWRCVDERNGVVFFVIAAGFSSAALSIWLPSLNRIVIPANIKQGQFSIANGPEFLSAVVRHLFDFGRDLVPFLNRSVSRMGHYTWPAPAVHVGHYHWNELPGLDKIVGFLEPKNYPIIFDLGGASRNCFYERLTKIYPELNRVIDLSCKSIGEMNRLAYKHGIQPIKFAGSFVSAGIRERIRRTFSLHPAHMMAQNVANNAKGPIVVFGLRVENRTVSNQREFYASLARRISEEYGSVTVLIDGHNVKEEKNNEAFISNQEQKATSKPIEVERALVSALKEDLQDDQITLIDCVGMTLRENLAWLQIADLCVAPWGAGLAKYRWALNIPAYILASQYCMKHKDDMEIYSSGEFMENPSSYWSVPAQFVKDQPELPVLIDIGGGYKDYYANYYVEPYPVIEEIIKQMTSLKYRLGINKEK